MINNLEITLRLDLIGLSQKQYLHIVDKLTSMMKENYPLSFKELDNMFHINARKYVTSLVDFPNMNKDEFEIGITKIDIRG